MLAGSAATMGTRARVARADNGPELNSLEVNAAAGPGSGDALETDRGQYEERDYTAEVVYSGSDQDSESGEDEEAPGPVGRRRGVKRERTERIVGRQAARTPGGRSEAYGDVSPGGSGMKPGKKTRGRVKIKMEFIDNKLRRYTTFSKRKTGIMKKAYELSTLTGTQVLLLVASETGHVYTFATRKLQPMITSETGKALIQTCLNSPDSPPRSDPSSDQRMSATGFEETDLTYQVSEGDGTVEGAKDGMKPTFSLPGSAQPSSSPSSSSSSVSMQVQSSAPSWQPPCSSSSSSSSSSCTNGTVLKTSAGVVLPGGFTLMTGAPLPPGTHTIPLSQLQGQPLAIQGPVAPGPANILHTSTAQPTTLLRLPTTVSLPGQSVSQQLQTIQVQASSQQTSSPDINPPTSSAAGLPVSIVSSSSSSSSSASGASHMVYPGAHTVMYATRTPSLGDGSLTVLNTFPPTGHTQTHDPTAVSQVFLTSLPQVAGQIPVSAVQLHPMVISGQSSSSSSNLTELQVVSLDVHQSKHD
ncbi:serum response factor-like isoform X2 [Salarias fasciatus]|uniref:serum response factor-like isoform X2 n=1 Tax=Salarias fasciatus TaxID=181472 RepID=UPI001176E4B3|nr:serum response factor-like isoform X2 [Salarias fasciatus]